MALVFLPDFNPFPESVLDLVPIHHEIESPIFDDHHIELENKCDPESQLDNTIPLSESIMTLVSSPDCNSFSESILDHVPVHREIELPIFYASQIELD